MKTFKPSIISLSALIFLASCGGGGGGNNSQPPLEGAFTGSMSNSGVRLTDLVLEDGSFWSTYTTSSGDIGGFSTGRVTSSTDRTFTMAFTDFPKPGNKPLAGNGSGVYTATSAAGSITEEGKTSTFEVTMIPVKNYVYKTPASTASVVGSWSGALLDGQKGSVDIRADGIFSGSSADDCKFNGKFSPNDKVNVFTLSVTFGGAPCALPGQTASGIGLTTLGDDGKNNLVVALVNDASKNVGFLFSAKR